MEDDPRPFESVHIGLTSVETGPDRFSTDGIFTNPPVACWRNNLTALSQRHNLYMVATKEFLAIYKPKFPFQKLQRLPSLVIPPALAQPQTRGYITPEQPHQINHVVVGDLGTQEIVVLATDSGNVAAYYTAAIEEAIRKDPYRFSTDARSDYVGLRPFFLQWVHESAWGLSIHTRARMIAVSANTPHHVQSEDPSAKVTVFAFGLTGGPEADGAGVDSPRESVDDAIDGDRQAEWPEWETLGAVSTPPPRDRNYKITLAGVDGHDRNIPCVSFVNTDQDPDGRYLLSTDIGGEMKMWLVWQGTCLKTWDFGEKRMAPGSPSRREGGWIVAALDPRAFRSAWTMDQFCGHSKAPRYYGHAGESYDITRIVRLRTPGNNNTNPILGGITDDEAHQAPPQDSDDSWSDIDDANIDANDGAAAPRWVDRAGTDDNASSVSNHSATSTSSSSHRNSSVDIEYDTFFQSQHHPDRALLTAPPDSRISQTANNATWSQHPAIPTLHCTASCLRLLSAPAADSPHVFCGSVLNQLMPPGLAETPYIQLDRLNMMQQIPELGIVIVATQVGRCALCSLTRNEKTGTFGLRVDWILPSKRQEARDVRPFITLHGVATSPIQGRFPRERTVAKASEKPSQWGTDAVVDGVTTTFDPTVLVIQEYGPADPDDSGGDDDGDDDEADDEEADDEEADDDEADDDEADDEEADDDEADDDEADDEADDDEADDDEADDEADDEVDDEADDEADDEVDDEADDKVDAGVGAETSSEPNTSRRQRVAGSQRRYGRVETKRWEVPVGAEPWQATENSRRYRLMMTYQDMTVLTYEISRGVERLDIVDDELPSSLELLD